MDEYVSSPITFSSIPAYQKYLLSIREAAEYYGIGEKKLRWLCAENPHEIFHVTVGNKLLIKKRQFEVWLDRVTSI